MSDNSLIVVTLKTGASSGSAEQFLRTLAPLLLKCKPTVSSCNRLPFYHLVTLSIYYLLEEVRHKAVHVLNYHGMKTCRGVEVGDHAFLISAMDEVENSSLFVWPKCETDRSSPTSVEDKNGRSLDSISLYFFMAWCCINLPLTSARHIVTP